MYHYNFFFFSKPILGKRKLINSKEEMSPRKEESEQWSYRLQMKKNKEGDLREDICNGEDLDLDFGVPRGRG